MVRIKSQNKRLISILAIITLLLLSVFYIGGGKDKGREAVAAEQAKKETIDLRIIGTTDLHGQLNSKDYELGVDYNNGGLARVFNKISQIKEEMPSQNVITVDAGDTLYDYATEYIFAEDQEAIQPIFQGMAKVGYDAITLGNHDFDYGYEYILRQLNGSGLRSITVVSNVMDSKTGEHPFQENMIISRKMKTSLGNEVQVNIGIIGLAIPNLTGKTHSYAGILRTENMVESATKQVDKLKELGADIIVAIAHTGMGPEDPEPNFKNQGYVLTKIPGIDVVVGGHEHKIYPTDDMTSPYYNLPGVSKRDYLVNGKNLMMAGDRGQAVGIADLTLQVQDGELSIIDRKTEIRKIDGNGTEENQEIASLYGDWEEELLKYTEEIIGQLDDGVVIQNYFGLLGDNTAIQLLNDSKIYYGLTYAHLEGREYRKLPIVAASSYEAYGGKSIYDYVNIHDEISESDLAAMQSYNNYLHIYKITGAQLKEWLEWSASAYEPVYLYKEWTNKTMKNVINEHNIKSLIAEEWLDDWRNFFIFDGIDYVINPSIAPRYDFSGNRITSNERVTSITYNGEEITEDMELLLVTNKITNPMAANQGIEKQSVKRGFVRGQSILRDYIYQVSKAGIILPHVDYNWNVTLPIGTDFIVKGPYYADDLMKMTPWYKELLAKKDGYGYYRATYSGINLDKRGPHIVLAPLVTGPTASSYEVAVSVTDVSGVKQVAVAKGDYNESNIANASRRSIKNGTFTVTENATYTVYAEDMQGNGAVKKIVIDNFRDDLIAKPKVENYTNRKSNISGRAEPNTSIVFEAYTGTYEGIVDPDGKFKYPLPSQPSGSTVTVYVKDEERDLESDRTKVRVNRTGPNQPEVNDITNKVILINGILNDDDATPIVIVDRKVYLSKDGARDLYEMSSIYEPSYRVIETEVDLLEDGHFVMLIPPQEAGKKVTIYNLDHIGRNSRIYTSTILEVAPNAPNVYEISNIEKSLDGFVPSSSNKIYEVILEIGDNVYTTNTDKKGNFTFEFTDQLYAGQKIKVTTRDTNGSISYSYPVEVLVNDIGQYVNGNSTVLYLDKFNEGDDSILGTYIYSGLGSLYLAITSGQGEDFTNSLHKITADDNDIFKLALDQELALGDKIYAMVRFTDRIYLANVTSVLPALPASPSLVRDITNTDKLVEVIADKDSIVTLTIGKKQYQTETYIYDEENDQYIYTFNTDRDTSGTEVTITASNEGGTSKPYTSKTVKVSPDRPKVDTVKVGDKSIKGKVEMLDDETQIFTKIGKKTYQGTVDEDGKYTIEVPKVKDGTVIRVWGHNKEGRGPLTKITVGK